MFVFRTQITFVSEIKNDVDGGLSALCWCSCGGR